MKLEDTKSLAFRIAKRNFPDDYVNCEWAKDGKFVVISVKRGCMVRIARVPVSVEEFDFSFNVQSECRDIKRRFGDNEPEVPTC
jgi:hypothetical protein